MIDATVLNAGSSEVTVRAGEAELFCRIGERAAASAFLIADRAGVVRRWPLSAERLFGHASAAALGRPVTLLLPFLGEPGDAAEGWCRRADGSHFRGQVAIVALAEGEGCALMVRDVSARHQVDELSREVQRRQQRLTASMARLVVYSIDLERGEVDVSDGLAEIIGWTRGAPPRRLDDLLSLCHDDDRLELTRRINQAVVTRGSFDMEIRVYADLGERWLQVVGSFIDDQHPRIVGNGMDVTARHRADEALRNSEAKLQAVLDATIDGIITIDEAGLIASANRTAANLFRRPVDALVGARWQSILEVRSAELPAAGRLHDISGLRADGSIFAMECGVSSVELAAHRLVICVLRDITERRLLERQVLDVSEQLQRQIGQDLHDGLGQLLTGTAFLAKGLEGNVTAEYQAQAQRVVELVNQGIARVRSLARGLSPIHVEAQSLEAVMGHVVAESSKLLGVECVLELRSPVETDRPATMVQLCLIAREAITNAVRHGHARRIVVSLEREGPRSLLSIEDDGSGIQQTHDSVEGLGLRSMRYRAKLIGGTLEVMRAEVGTAVRCWWEE